MNQQLQRPSDVQTVKSLLTQNKEIMALSMPSFLTADRLIGVALIAMAKQPLLQQCTRASLIASIRQAGILGLEPDGVQGVLIPYKNNKLGIYECQFQPMYQGLIKLGHTSDKLTLFYAEVVYENDKFSMVKGLRPSLFHEPLLSGDRGKVIGAYSVFGQVNGGADFEYMTLDEIIKVKNKSRAGKKADSPWNTWPEEMYKKTVLKRLSKRMPKNEKLQQAVKYDHQVQNPNQQVSVDHLLEDLSEETRADLPPPIQEPQSTKIGYDPGSEENDFTAEVEVGKKDEPELPYP